MQDNLDPATSAAQDPGTVVTYHNTIPRSDKWPAVEKAHLQMQPACVACGATSGLQVHHMLPFHFCVQLGRPELELDQRNLITLCDETVNSHHLLLGHLQDWQSYNPNVHADIAGPLKSLSAAQIESDPTWQSEKQQRPPDLEHMSDTDIATLKQLMATWYPLQPAAQGTSTISGDSPLPVTLTPVVSPAVVAATADAPVAPIATAGQ